MTGDGSFFPDPPGSQYSYHQSKSVLSYHPVLEFNGNKNDFWLLFDDSGILEKDKSRSLRKTQKPSDSQATSQLKEASSKPGFTNTFTEATSKGGFLRPKEDDELLQASDNSKSSDKFADGPTGKEARPDRVNRVGYDSSSRKKDVFRESKRSRSGERHRSASSDRRRSPIRDRRTGDRRGLYIDRRRSRSREGRGRNRSRSKDRLRRRSKGRERKRVTPSSSWRYNVSKRSASISSSSSDGDSKGKTNKAVNAELLKKFAEKLQEKADKSTAKKSLSSVRLNSRLEDTKHRRAETVTPIVFSLKKAPTKSFPAITLPPRMEEQKMVDIELPKENVAVTTENSEPTNQVSSNINIPLPTNIQYAVPTPPIPVVPPSLIPAPSSVAQSAQPLRVTDGITVACAPTRYKDGKKAPVSCAVIALPPALQPPPTVVRVPPPVVFQAPPVISKSPQDTSQPPPQLSFPTPKMSQPMEVPVITEMHQTLAAQALEYAAMAQAPDSMLPGQMVQMGQQNMGVPPPGYGSMMRVPPGPPPGLPRPGHGIRPGMMGPGHFGHPGQFMGPPSHVPERPFMVAHSHGREGPFMGPPHGPDGRFLGPPPHVSSDGRFLGPPPHGQGGPFMGPPPCGPDGQFMGPSGHGMMPPFFIPQGGPQLSLSNNITVTSSLSQSINTTTVSQQPTKNVTAAPDGKKRTFSSLKSTSTVEKGQPTIAEKMKPSSSTVKKGKTTCFPVKTTTSNAGDVGLPTSSISNKKKPPSKPVLSSLSIPNFEKMKFMVGLIKFLQNKSNLNMEIARLKESPSSECCIKNGLLCKLEKQSEDDVLVIVVPEDGNARRIIVTAVMLKYPDMDVDALIELFEQTFHNMPMEDIEDVFEDESTRSSTLLKSTEADFSKIESIDPCGTVVLQGESGKHMMNAEKAAPAKRSVEVEKAKSAEGCDKNEKDQEAKANMKSENKVTDSSKATGKENVTPSEVRKGSVACTTETNATSDKAQAPKELETAESSAPSEKTKNSFAKVDSPTVPILEIEDIPSELSEKPQAPNGSETEKSSEKLKSSSDSVNSSCIFKVSVTPKNDSKVAYSSEREGSMTEVHSAPQWGNEEQKLMEGEQVIKEKVATSLAVNDTFNTSMQDGFMKDATLLKQATVGDQISTSHETSMDDGKACDTEHADITLDKVKDSGVFPGESNMASMDIQNSDDKASECTDAVQETMVVIKDIDYEISSRDGNVEPKSVTEIFESQGTKIQPSKLDSTKTTSDDTVVVELSTILKKPKPSQKNEAPSAEKSATDSAKYKSWGIEAIPGTTDEHEDPWFFIQTGDHKQADEKVTEDKAAPPKEATAKGNCEKLGDSSTLSIQKPKSHEKTAESSVSQELVADAAGEPPKDTAEENVNMKKLGESLSIEKSKSDEEAAESSVSQELVADITGEPPKNPGKENREKLGESLSIEKFKYDEETAESSVHQELVAETTGEPQKDTGEENSKKLGESLSIEKSKSDEETAESSVSQELVAEITGDPPKDTAKCLSVEKSKSDEETAESSVSQELVDETKGEPPKDPGEENRKNLGESLSVEKSKSDEETAEPSVSQELVAKTTGEPPTDTGKENRKKLGESLPVEKSKSDEETAESSVSQELVAETTGEPPKDTDKENRKKLGESLSIEKSMSDEETATSSGSKAVVTETASEPPNNTAEEDADRPGDLSSLSIEKSMSQEKNADSFVHEELANATENVDRDKPEVMTKIPNYNPSEAKTQVTAYYCSKDSEPPDSQSTDLNQSNSSIAAVPSETTIVGKEGIDNSATVEKSASEDETLFTTVKDGTDSDSKNKSPKELEELTVVTEPHKTQVLPTEAIGPPIVGNEYGRKDVAGPIREEIKADSITSNVTEGGSPRLPTIRPNINETPLQSDKPRCPREPDPLLELPAADAQQENYFNEGAQSCEANARSDVHPEERTESDPTAYDLEVHHHPTGKDTQDEHQVIDNAPDLNTFESVDKKLTTKIAAENTKEAVKSTPGSIPPILLDDSTQSDNQRQTSKKSISNEDPEEASTFNEDVSEQLTDVNSTEATDKCKPITTPSTPMSKNAAASERSHGPIQARNTQKEVEVIKSEEDGAKIKEESETHSKSSVGDKEERTTIEIDEVMSKNISDKKAPSQKHKFSKFKSTYELMKSMDFGEPKELYKEPDSITIVNYEKLSFFTSRLKEIQKDSDISSVTKEIMFVPYCHTDTFVMKSGLLCKRNDQHKNDVLLVILKSTAVYREIVSALTEQYPDMEFNEFMSLIDVSFAYITTAEIKSLTETIGLQKVFMNYHNFVERCKIVNYNIIHTMLEQLRTMQKADSAILHRYTRLRANGGVDDSYILKHDIVCQFVGSIDFKVWLPKSQPDQIAIMYIVHETNHNLDIVKFLGLLQATFEGVNASLIDKPIALCSICHPPATANATSIVKACEQKCTALKSLPPEVIYKIRQIQMASSVYKAQIDLLTKGQSRQGSRYILDSSLLCKAMTKGNEEVFRVVISPSGLTEVVSLLHATYHRKPLDEFVSFVNEFLAVSKAVCKSAFQECYICMKGKFPRTSFDTPKPQIVDTPQVSENKRYEPAPKELTRTSSGSSKILPEKTAKAKEQESTRKDSKETPKSTKDAPPKEPSKQSYTEPESLKPAWEVKEKATPPSRTACGQKIRKQAMRDIHTHERIWGRELGDRIKLMLRVVPDQILSDTITSQRSCPEFIKTIKDLERIRPIKDAKDMLCGGILLVLKGRMKPKIAVKPIKHINYLLITKFHSEVHDWSINKIHSSIGSAFDVSPSKEEVEKTINWFCHRCMKPKTKNKKLYSSLDEELKAFYGTIEPILSSKKASKESEEKPKKTEENKPETRDDEIFEEIDKDLQKLDEIWGKELGEKIKAVSQPIPALVLRAVISAQRECAALMEIIEPLETGEPVKDARHVLCGGVLFVVKSKKKTMLVKIHVKSIKNINYILITNMHTACHDWTVNKLQTTIGISFDVSPTREEVAVSIEWFCTECQKPDTTSKKKKSTASLEDQLKDLYDTIDLALRKSKDDDDDQEGTIDLTQEVHVTDVRIALSKLPNPVVSKIHQAQLQSNVLNTQIKLLENTDGPAKGKGYCLVMSLLCKLVEINEKLAWRVMIPSDMLKELVVELHTVHYHDMIQEDFSEYLNTFMTVPEDMINELFASCALCLTTVRRVPTLCERGINEDMLRKTLANIAEMIEYVIRWQTECPAIAKIREGVSRCRQEVIGEYILYKDILFKLCGKAKGGKGPRCKIAVSLLPNALDEVIKSTHAFYHSNNPNQLMNLINTSFDLTAPKDILFSKIPELCNICRKKSEKAQQGSDDGVSSTINRSAAEPAVKEVPKKMYEVACAAICDRSAADLVAMKEEVDSPIEIKTDPTPLGVLLLGRLCDQVIEESSNSSRALDSPVPDIPTTETIPSSVIRQSCKIILERCRYDPEIVQQVSQTAAKKRKKGPPKIPAKRAKPSKKAPKIIEEPESSKEQSDSASGSTLPKRKFIIYSSESETDDSIPEKRKAAVGTSQKAKKPKK